MPTIATPPSARLPQRGDEARRAERPADSLASPLLRLRVATRRSVLNQELSEGVTPTSSPERALRAAQLTAPHRRRALARSLRRSLTEARQPALTRFPPPLVCRQAVLDAQRPLERLIRRLNDDAPVTAEGMALVERILTDGEWSPLYNTTVPGALRRLAVLSTAALDDD